MIWRLFGPSGEIASFLSQEDAVSVLWEMIHGNLDRFGNARQPHPYKLVRKAT